MSKFRNGGTSVVVWGAPCDYAINGPKNAFVKSELGSFIASRFSVCWQSEKRIVPIVLRREVAPAVGEGLVSDTMSVVARYVDTTIVPAVRESRNPPPIITE